MYNGVINIYKEKGFTSFDVIAKMRGILKQKKLGHTGTLDPDAVGVLPVCVGNATKLCDMLTDHNKEYIAELLLGVETDTQDTTGEVLCKKEVVITEEKLREIIQGFVGEKEQIPPMYSAIKIDGKRLYELARSGKEVERKPRKVTFFEIEILEIRIPVVKIKVACSKGTYIRTLCHDIGQAAGCGGAMQSLERVKTGSFEKKDAITLSELEKLRDENRIEEVLIPTDKMFDCKAVHVPDEFMRFVLNGNSFYDEDICEKQEFADKEWVRVYDTADKFYGVYEYKAEEKLFKPYKMFLN